MASSIWCMHLKRLLVTSCNRYKQPNLPTSHLILISTQRKLCVYKVSLQFEATFVTSLFRQLQRGCYIVRHTVLDSVSVDSSGYNVRKTLGYFL